MAKKTVLVTGATGKQGGAVARALLAGGHRVRALTRKPDAPAAKALATAGAEPVAGDFADRASLERAVRGTDAVFAMSTPFEAGMETETAQGQALVEAARAVGVGHFVYTSVGSADQKTGIPHFDSKFRVEEALRASGLTWTILGPVYFMDNLLAPWTLPSLKEGVLAQALPPGRKLQQVAVEDIGRFGALVIERGGEFAGKRIDLASDELSNDELAAILTRVTGKTIRYQPLPVAELRKQNEDFGIMMEWFDRVGYRADVAGLRREYPQVGWHRFEEWARKLDWRALLG